MRKYLLILAAALTFASPALADWTGKDASGNTITFSNPVDCTSGTCIPIAALVNAAGATLYGTAGTANAGVLSIQGIASMTPVASNITQVLGAANSASNGLFVRMGSGQVASGAYASGAFASGSFSSGAFASGSYASGAFAAGSMVDLLTMRGTVAAGTAASNSLLAGGIYNSTPITMSNGQGAALQFDANGYLKVNTAAGAAAGGTSSNFGSAFPTPGTAVGFTDGTNMVAGRVGAVANVAAATNFLNSLGICQYLATPPTITDTRFNQIQCDVNGNTKVTVTNTLTAITPGDDITTSTYASASPVIGVPLLWDGTNYDRWKSAGATGVASVRQTDGTTNSTMKAASTPAVASDTAMVVDQRPGTNVTIGPYPAGAVPYTATNTGTTGATTATLAGASSVTTYICGFSIRANATAAATGNATVTGVITATMNFTQWTAPLASGIGVTEMIFSPCIPASGTNQSVAVVSAAPGSGGTVSVTAWGYKL